MIRGGSLPLLLSLGLASGAEAGCAHQQTAPTPAPPGSTTTIASASSSITTSTNVAPWTRAASIPSPTLADVTAPMNEAMALCSSALNLAPCGVVVTGTDDIMTCFQGCQNQIVTVVSLTIERAARKCAEDPPPEAGPRQCTLEFPPTAALDLEVAGATCNKLCDELAERERR